MDSSIKIPGYRIEAEIGKGGMATVYLAIQESLAREVALKIMARNMIADPSAEKRFLKEGKIVARLNHPNIVTVFDIGRVDEIYYMAMEYIEGGNLNERIQQGLDIENVLDITRQIARALAYAHKRGFIHRDVKPANILFREDNTAVLSDFGIAKVVSSQTKLTGTGQTIGTPEYMSPEQVSGEPLDPRSDLYSLGVVLFEILTRQNPFKGEDAISTAMRHMVAPLPRLPARLSDYQPLLDSLLAKHPDERFSTAEKLVQALDDLLGKIKPVIEPSETAITRPGLATVVAPNEIEPSGEYLRSRNLRLAALLTALIVAIGAALFYWQRTHRIDPQTRMLINMFLAQAQRQTAASRLIEPAGDNAYQNYRNILELEPQNSQALDGLEEIADSIEAQAVAKQQQELFAEGQALIEQGLKVSPQHSGLLELQDKLKQQREEGHLKKSLASIDQGLRVVPEHSSPLALRREANQRIMQRQRGGYLEGLLAKAEQQLAALKLTRPPGDNAFESYTQILEILPREERALTGVQRIADRYLELGQANLNKGTLNTSLAMIERGLEVASNHSGLLDLRDEAYRKLEILRDQQQELQTLLNKAQRQFQSHQITTPTGDNAYETYLEVLTIDARNQRAKEGLQKITDYYEALAKTKQDAGELRRGLAMVGVGLKVDTNHSGLLALKEEITSALKSRMLKKQRLEQLLAAAQARLDAGQYTRPKGNSAYEIYQQILQLDPHNLPALEGLHSIADYYEDLAQEKLQEGDLQQGLSIVEEGLRIRSKHKGLLLMQTKLTHQLKPEYKEKSIKKKSNRTPRPWGTF